MGYRATVLRTVLQLAVKICVCMYGCAGCGGSLGDHLGMRQK